MVYFFLSTAFFIGGIAISYWIHNQYQMDMVVEPAPPPQDPPLISICIPARNEERNIRACVEATLSQDYPKLEVIVLDDRSTDSTPTILQEIASIDLPACAPSTVRTYPWGQENKRQCPYCLCESDYTDGYCHACGAPPEKRDPLMEQPHWDYSSGLTNSTSMVSIVPRWTLTG